MLSPSKSRVAVLESSTNAKLLTVTTKSTLDLSPQLSYANFVGFTANDSFVWAGGAKGSEDGVIVVREEVILRRAKAKPLQCRIVRLSEHESSSAEIPQTMNVEEEIWSIWSDRILSTVRLISGSHIGVQKFKPMYYRLDGVSDVCDFLILTNGLIPEVTGWKRPARQIVVCGSNPGLGTFSTYPTDASTKSGQRGLLAVAAASALTSAMSSFARRWLVDSEDESEQEKEEQEENSVWLHTKVRFDDSREFTSLSLGKEFCAAADTLGRVFVFHPLTLQITRVLKGYRCPQLAFQSVLTSSEPTLESADLLLVYAPLSRGNRLELWRTTGGNGDGDRPFASARTSGNVHIAVDPTGQHCALYDDNEFISTLDLSVIFSPSDFEWDSYLSRLRTYLRSTSSTAMVPSSFPIPKRMFENPEQAFARFFALEDASDSDKITLGIDFYSHFLQSQLEHLNKSPQSPNTSSLIKMCQQRLTRVEMFKRWHERAKKAIWNSEYVDEKELNSPRKFALEASVSASVGQIQIPPQKLLLFWIASRSLTAATSSTVLSREPPRAALDVLFHPLLMGDVFLVREVEQDLKALANKAGFDEEELTRDAQVRFIEWWVNNPVEKSPGWKHSSTSSNALAKFACEALRLPFQTLRTMLSEKAKGRIKLARGAMLCKCFLNAAQVEGDWLTLYSQLDLAFRVCVQLFPSIESLPEREFGVERLNQVSYLYEQMVQTCLVEGQKLQLSSSSDEVIEPAWKRSSDPMSQLVRLVGESILSTPQQRNEFRMHTVLHVMSGEASSAKAAWLESIVQDLMDEEDEEDDGRLGRLAQITMQLAQLTHMRHDLAVNAQLLSKCCPTSRARNIVNCIVLADQVQEDEGLLSELWKHLKTYLTAVMDAPSTETSDGDGFEKIANKVFLKKLELDAAKLDDDEQFRQLAKRIGLNEPNEVHRVMALNHYAHARDARGNACFDRIVDEHVHAETATEALKLCRLRMAAFLKFARGTKELAPLVASVGPKTVSWLLSLQTESVTQIPLKSTLSVLNKIEDYLPGSDEGSSASTVSPRTRCTQLQALAEIFLDHANNVAQKKN